MTYNIKISKVKRSSPVTSTEIDSGDFLLEVNGKRPRDILEYQFLTSESEVELKIQKADGRRLKYSVEKQIDCDLGLEFKDLIFDGMKKCHNSCFFCFIDQLPKKMRNPLYIKDDDYRLSFLYGNYISLTNLNERDWDSIIQMRLSPLYISVHTVNPGLRKEIFKNPEAEKIKEQLKRLTDNRIQLHTQVVLCPGVNDGRYLEETINYLASLYPGVLSLAVVPVGITRYSSNSDVRKNTRKEAAKIINMIESYQLQLKEELGTRFVFAADEFYLKGKFKLPSELAYEDYPQVENGVGLIRSFLSEFSRLEDKLPASINHPGQFTVVTGQAAEGPIKHIIKRLNQIKGLTIEPAVIPNYFFGKDLVNVVGLLTGRDIIKYFKNKDRMGKILIPACMINDKKQFLDGIELDDLEEKLGHQVIPIKDLQNLIEVLQRGGRLK